MSSDAVKRSVILLALVACNGPILDDFGSDEADADSPDVAQAPDSAADAADADAGEGPIDVADVDVEPDLPAELMCPEGTRHLEVECIPEAFYQRDAGPLEPCVPVLAPVAADPDCSVDCRVSGLPGLLWEVPAGTPVHAPVGGTVSAVATGWPTRAEAADCYEVPDKGTCCGLDAVVGNFVTIKDRKNRLWTLSHLAPGAHVATGDVVRAGQAVGIAGDSGYLCGDGARVHLAARVAAGALDISRCLTGSGAGAEPPDCRDRDLDTYGVGPDCDAQDCNDNQAAWQSFDASHRACLGESLDGQNCADRDGDGAFAGSACPWPDEDCDDFDVEVQLGCEPNTCACDDGPCCDGCAFLGTDTQCADALDERYVCTEGTDCGADVFAQVRVQFCAGDSADCAGAVVWTDPARAQACTRDAICQQGHPACVPDEVCATSCEGDADCGDDQHCADGTCAGDLCAAGERFCAGLELRLCTDNGGDSSLLDTCDLGCEDGSCLLCPSNVCDERQLGPGEHCVDGGRVVCEDVEGCVVATQVTACEDPAPLCAEGDCVACLVNRDCPSPRQDCMGGACVCRHGCDDGDSGCQDDTGVWTCREDAGGCRQRVIEACLPQHACMDGLCERVCEQNFCQDAGLRTGAYCDGRTRVVCGADDVCAVEDERTNCRGDTRFCLDGDCVACLVDLDCPSPRQTCDAGACVCRHGCAEGTVGCLNDDTSWRCVEDDGQCRFMRAASCDDGFVCDAGACVRDCADNACQRAGQGTGMLCDGARRVDCREVNGCFLERFWQDCGCGCAQGVCAPCEADGPLLVLGTGEDAYEVTNNGDSVGVYAGHQGGHHVFGAFRLFGAEQRSNTVQHWRILDGDVELAVWDTFGNLQDEGDHAVFFGETVQFFLGTQPGTLDGLPVRLTLTLDVDDTSVHDERDIILRWPP